MPVNKQIIDYVNTHKHGHSIDSLKSQLTKSGWSEQDVNDSINSMHGPINQKKSQHTSMNVGFTTKFIKGLIKPKELFESVREENGFAQAFKYFVIIIFGSTILSGGMILTQYSTMIPMAGLFLVGIMQFSFIIIFLISFASYLVSMYLSVGLTHIVVHTLGGKNGLHQTFKAIVYGSSGHMILLSAISILVFLLFPSGTTPSPTLETPLPTASIGSIILLILTIPIAIWALFNQIVGISILHNVSKKKALLMLILIPLVLILIAALGAAIAFSSLSGYMGSIPT